MCALDHTTPHGGQALTDSSLKDELIDELDEHGVPWELLTGWAAMEAKEMKILAMAKGQPQIPEQVREAALRFLHALAGTLRLKTSGWLDAALLFDRYCLSSSGMIRTESLPELCVAIATIVKKNDDSGNRRRAARGTGTRRSSVIDTVALSQLATQYGHWLSGMGFSSGAHSVDEEDIFSQEKNVLTALDWSIGVPSVQAWIGALCRRFDVLTVRMQSATLEWIKSQGITSAGMLVLNQVAFASMTPRAMANGLFCTFLIVAATLPAEALQPAELTEREWEDLLSESQCRVARPSSTGRPAASQSLLSLLQVVAGCGLPTLRADTHAVVRAMRDIAVGHRGESRCRVASVATVQTSSSRIGCVR